jgi:hypothetical protein
MAFTRASPFAEIDCRCLNGDSPVVHLSLTPSLSLTLSVGVGSFIGAGFLHRTQSASPALEPKIADRVVCWCRVRPRGMPTGAMVGYRDAGSPDYFE